MNRLFFLIVTLLLLACANVTASGKDTLAIQSVVERHTTTLFEQAPARKLDKPDIFRLNSLLGRGINLSGLEQAFEGSWNFKLRNDALTIIADGGFDSVRLPIKWDSHAAARRSNTNGVYRIDPAFFARVDSVIDDALSLGLRVVLNMHLYEDLIKDPQAEAGRFISLWDQIARHYADRSDYVYFELLNEPAGQFIEQPQFWNELLVHALHTIRVSNPDRAVLVGPVGWNSIEYLPVLRLPVDNRLIVSVHYYEPSHFTHQGANWVQPILPTGVKWFPRRQRLGAGLQNWSWDTEVDFLDDEVDVTFARSGAALNIYSQPENFPTRMSVSVKGSVQLAVICSAGIYFYDTDVRIVSDSIKWTTFTADLSQCPRNSNKVALQNRGERGVSIRLRGGELCQQSLCRPFLMSQEDAINHAFETVRRWGELEHRPMNLGEFGAYKTADMASRVRWTKAVQKAALSRGLSTHYWEFEQGFGLWDRKRHGWRAQLYQALQP